MRRKRHLRILSIALVAGILLGSLSMFATPVRHALAASVYFDDYGGSTNATFGPNATIMITGDLEGGCITLGEFSANVYVVPHGSIDPNSRTKMAATPNAVISSSLSGGLYDSEVIGFTAPSGKIGTGDYDVVLDLCGDGYYDPTPAPSSGGIGFVPATSGDYIAGVGDAHGAFTVNIPNGVPLLPSPEIAALKSSSQTEATSWKNAQYSAAGLFALYDTYGIVSSLIGDPGEVAVGFYLDWVCSALPGNADPNIPITPYCPTVGWGDTMRLQFLVLKNMLAEAAHYQAIANDPPDSNYTQIASLDPTQTFTPNTSDPLEASFTSLGTQVSTENATLAALLHSIERYQGAQQAGDAQSALAQAQMIQYYASILSARLPNTDTLLSNVATQTANSGKDFAGHSTYEVNLLARLKSSGFTPGEVAGLKNAGLSQSDIDALLARLTAPAGPNTSYTLDTYQTVGDIQTNVQAVRSANSQALTAAQNLSTAMGPIITNLESQAANIRPTANSGGPYTGTVGTALTFDGSASSTPSGTGTLTYAWDLDGDGNFTDASGAKPSFTFTAPHKGLVGLEVTNGSGQTDIAYAPITITNPNQPPVITTTSPTGNVANISTGTAQTFSATVTDAENDALAYSWTYDGLPVSTSTSYTRAFTTADVGLHTLALSVSDPGGTASWHWGLLVTAPVTLTSLAVTPAAPSIHKGATQQFTATGTYSDGTTADLTSSVTWSSDTTSVATVNGSGLATGIDAGTAKITATRGAVNGSATLTVTAPTLNSIAITPAGPSIAKGTTQQFTATGSYSDGSTADLTNVATWSSATTGVATINATGLATAVAQGTSQITASFGGLSASTILTVTAPALTSIAISPASPSVPKGATRQFTATGTYTDGSTADLTSSVAWSSATASVATISASGLATAAGQGTSLITASSGGLSASTILTVTAPALTSIAVTPANPSIAKGLTQQFTATGTYTDGTTADLTHSATWSSGTTSVATIDANGLAKGAGTGQSTITATLGSVSGSTTLTVTAPVLTSIAVTPANPSIALGQTRPFTATGTYTDGSTLDLSGSVTWTSGNTGVATISAGGVASSVAQGTSTITATLGSVSGATTLTVTAPKLVSIAVSPASPSIVRSTTQQFTATGTYTDGTQADVTNSVTWTSNTTGVATINATGLAKGVGTGTSLITASSSGLGASTLLTVTLPALSSIAVTPATLSLYQGATAPFKALGTYADNITSDITSSVTWSSANTSVATIAANGQAKAVAVGTSTITASSGGLSGSATLSVIAPGTALAPVFYVTQRFNTGIAQVNVNASGVGTVTANYVTGLPASGPDSVVFDHHGNMLVSNTEAGTISMINPTTRAIVEARVNNTLIGTIADLALDPASDTVWAISYSGNTIARVDLATGTTTNLNPNNVSNLGGITFNADGSRLFVSSHASQIVEISPVDGHVIRSVSVPGSPDGMTFDPTTNEAFASGCGGLCELYTGTDAQPALSLVRVHNALDGDGIAADGQGHVYVVNGFSNLYRLDLATETAHLLASGIPSADDVAPAVGAGSAPPTLKAADASGIYSGTATLSATLSANGSGVSGKTVTFTLNGQSFANNTAVTDANGVATLSGATLAGINVGSYATGIGASFAGDSSVASASGSAALSVTPAPTTTTPASVNGDVGNGTISLSATVTANSPATATVNEGTVSFTLMQSGASVGSPVAGIVTSGTATAALSLSGLAAGSYTIVASYADGNSPANFTGSIGNATLTLTQSVCAVDTTPAGFAFTKVTDVNGKTAVRVDITDPSPSSGLQSVSAYGNNLQIVDNTTGALITPAGWTSPSLTSAFQAVVTYSDGTHTTYTFYAEKINNSQSATITVQSVDQCGNIGDPPFTLNGKGIHGTRQGPPHGDHKKVKVDLD